MKSFYTHEERARVRGGRKEGRGEGWRMVEIEGGKGDMDRVRKEGGEDKGRGEGSMKRRQEEGWSFFFVLLWEGCSI